jgi:hypothetical protein
MRRDSTVRMTWGPDHDEMSPDEKQNGNASNWRELLADILRNPREKQLLLDELNVRSITLTRWVNGETEPRQQNLQQLVKALTRYCDYLPELLKNEKNTVDLSLLLANQERASSKIPSEFYSRVLASRAQTPEHMRFWTIANMILRQAMDQLDPSHQGIALWLTRCMCFGKEGEPENNRMVRSLRLTLGYHTNKPLDHMEQEGMFLGIESAEGETLIMGHPIVYQNLSQAGLLTPKTPVIEHRCAAICPIVYQGFVAGTFSVASTREDFFLLPERATLIQQYSDLLALAFGTEEFIPRQNIMLSVMPDFHLQRKHFAGFRQRVAAVMIEKLNQGESISHTEAENIIWHKLEEELLALDI